MRYELTEHEWGAIKPMLPNKPRGVPWVNDRRVLDPGLPGAICRKRLARTLLATTASFAGGGQVSRASRIMDSLTAAHDAVVQMIDTSIVRVHQHGGVHHKEPAAVDGTVTRRVDQQDSCAQQTALA